MSFIATVSFILAVPKDTIFKNGNYLSKKFKLINLTLGY